MHHMNQMSLSSPENRHHISCRDCALHPICDPTPVGSITLDIAESLVFKKQPIKAGQVIYHEGQPFEDLYAFTVGSAKEVWHSNQAQQQIISFKFKGELAGQNAIAHGVYPYTLIALEDCSVCTIRYQDLLSSANSLPLLLTKIIKLLSNDSHHESEIRKSLSTTSNAEVKVKSFLHNLSTRYKARNENYIDIKLSMSRSDIANYLGITKETLSRSLTSLQTKNLIEISGKYVHISKIDLLSDIKTNPDSHPNQ